MPATHTRASSGGGIKAALASISQHQPQSHGAAQLSLNIAVMAPAMNGSGDAGHATTSASSKSNAAEPLTQVKATVQAAITAIDTGAQQNPSDHHPSTVSAQLGHAKRQLVSSSAAQPVAHAAHGAVTAAKHVHLPPPRRSVGMFKRCQGMKCARQAVSKTNALVVSLQHLLLQRQHQLTSPWVKSTWVRSTLYAVSLFCRI